MVIRRKKDTGTTVATTHLDSLATSTGVLCAEFDNSVTGELWPFAELELNVDFVSAPSAGGRFFVFVCIAPDGVNYGTIASNTAPSELYPMKIGEFYAGATTAAQRLHCDVRIPPCKFKLYLFNATSQNMPANGSTIVLTPYTEETLSS